MAELLSGESCVIFVLTCVVFALVFMNIPFFSSLFHC